MDFFHNPIDQTQLATLATSHDLLVSVDVSMPSHKIVPFAQNRSQLSCQIGVMKEVQWFC